MFPRVPGALGAPCPGRAHPRKVLHPSGCCSAKEREQGASPGHTDSPAARFGDISSAGISQSIKVLQGARHGGRRRRRREPGLAAGSAGGGGHAPYLGVTMVIAVVGWRMWQVVMVKVDGVWGRLLTERNTGRDRRQGVNGEGAGHRRDRQSWAGSSKHGAQLRQQLRLVPAQRGQPAQLGPGDAVCPRPGPSRQAGSSGGSPG